MALHFVAPMHVLCLRNSRFAQFSPSQMATFVAALSRLVQGPTDDAVVCDIVTQFSEYSSGNGKMARFPPEERDFGKL